MNDTQVVIAVGYTVLVIVVGVAAAMILRSTRGRAQADVDTGRLAHLEGRWGAIVVVALGVLLFATIFSVPYGKTEGGDDAQQVIVTGQQFGWAVQPAEVEAGRQVEFELVSKDVQHGFGVYDGTELVFQVQVPAEGQTPQRYTHTFAGPGTYDILCLEFLDARAAVAGRCGMSTLEKALADYLVLRRSLGYELGRPSLHMAEFVAYLEERGADTVTTEHAVAWATLPSGADPNYWHYRLYSIRGFARYLHARDPAHEVPPDGLIPRRSSRAAPYLYSNEEIAALIATAGRLPHPLRADTYRTLIGLLAATGMRGGEAIALDLDDVDWAHGLLVVRNGKFGKSREVALHDSTLAGLERYLERRRRLCPRPGHRPCFCRAGAPGCATAT